MKNFLPITLLILFAYALTYSQTKTDDIKELFKLMQTEQNVDHTMANMVNMMKQQVKGKIADERKFREYMGYVVSESGRVTKQMVYTDMINSYARHFTHQEIKEYIYFYKSPAGQKMIDMQSTIQQELIQLMSEEYMPELQAKFKAKLEELNQN